MSLITIITGQLTPLFVIHIVKAYSHTKDKLVSTWSKEDPNLIHILESHGFIVVLSEAPSNNGSFNMQAVAAKAALEKARELGYTHICKTRTDVFPNNHEHFLNVTKDLYSDKIMSICGINTYILDIFMIGPINQMTKAYKTLQDKEENRFPEGAILENMFDKSHQTKEEIREQINFALTRCQEHGLEITWYRPPQWKNPLRSIPYMKVISEYCRDDFIWV